MRNWSTPTAKLTLWSRPLACALVFCLAGLASAQDVHILPVRKNIYMLVGAGGNITVSAGPDGALLVDSGQAQMTLERLTHFAARRD